MGTNFYLHPKPSDPQGVDAPEPLHIGKSSMGWCFALRVYAEQNINSLDDWIREFDKPGAVIRDEYGVTIEKEGMLATITKRSRAAPGLKGWTDEELARNHAVRGPNGLARHVFSDAYGRRSRAGEGTFDYCNYEFS